MDGLENLGTTKNGKSRGFPPRVALRPTLVVKAPCGIVATTFPNVFEQYLGLGNDGDNE